jgi:glycosyltransferase involved in cell wall biosynthesis
MPSICPEGQPRSVLEAYAAGVPVIAHATGGLAEVVTPGETGLLVDLLDRAGWVEAVERVADDAEAIRLGEAARARWQSSFSPERALENLEAAYRDAVGVR